MQIKKTQYVMKLYLLILINENGPLGIWNLHPMTMTFDNEDHVSCAI